MPTTVSVFLITWGKTLATVPMLQMRNLRVREVKEEFACRLESHGLKQDLPMPKPVMVLFCQDALESSQGLSFPIAGYGEGTSPSFIHSLIHSINTDVPDRKDPGGNCPVLVL